MEEGNISSFMQREIPPGISKLMERYENDEEILWQVLSIALEDLPITMDQIDDANLSRDWLQLKKGSHSMANITGTIFETEAMTIARKLEKSVVDQDYTGALGLIEPLRAEVTRILAVIDGYLNQ